MPPRALRRPRRAAPAPAPAARAARPARRRPRRRGPERARGAQEPRRRGTPAPTSSRRAVPPRRPARMLRATRRRRPSGRSSPAAPTLSSPAKVQGGPPIAERGRRTRSSGGMRVALLLVLTLAFPATASAAGEIYTLAGDGTLAVRSSDGAFAGRIGTFDE